MKTILEHEVDVVLGFLDVMELDNVDVVARTQHFDLVLEQLVEFAFEVLSVYCFYCNVFSCNLVVAFVDLSELPLPDAPLKDVVVHDLHHTNILLYEYHLTVDAEQSSRERHQCQEQGI